MSENKTREQEYWDKEYAKLEESFVSYKDLTVVEEFDNITDQERFTILPSTGTGVIGKYLSSREMENIIPNIIVRETVYKKLCNADSLLKRKNQNYQLVVVNGYRSLEIQRASYEEIKEQLKEKYHDDPVAWKEAAHRKIAVPEVAGHPTGGAVDVTVRDLRTQAYLNFGTEIHDLSRKAYYKAGELIKRKDVMENRRMLREVMGKQDFAPYDGEWWHFSYGDKEWAYYKYKKRNCTGELKYKYNQKEFSEIFFSDVYTNKYKKVELITKEWIRLAVQKYGRLTDETIKILKQSGIEINYDNRQFLTKCSNFPLEILFVRDDDIPNFVLSGIADLGIVGENVYYEALKENTNNTIVLKKLGYGHCTLVLAVPNNSSVKTALDLEGKRIATSYPYLTNNFFKNMDVKIQEPCFISGSVEIAPAINYAEAIVELVSSGESLRQNNLRFVQKILDSQSILITNNSIEKTNANKWAIITDFVKRINSSIAAKKYKYIIMDVPKYLLDKTREKINKEIKESFSDFNPSILEDSRIIKLFLSNSIPDEENTLDLDELSTLPVETEKSFDKTIQDRIKNIIEEIKNNFMVLQNLEKCQVHTLVDTTISWEDTLKKIGVTNIIVFDVERIIN